MTTRGTVLLIGNDDKCREEIHRLIDGRYHVIDARLAKEALALAGSESLDCVLLDHRLPDQSGLEIIHQLAARSLPVVMLAVDGSEALAVEAMKRGCHDYLVTRDLTREDLWQAIACAIDSQVTRRALDLQREELSAFVATAAHDLKSPLRHVIRYCDFTAEGIDSGDLDEARATLRTAKEAAQRLQSLVSALLEYTQLPNGAIRFEAVELEDILRVVQQECGEQLEASAGRIDASPLPVVSGDRHLLTQLFANLLENGLKFRREEPPIIRIEAEEDDDRWQVSFIDNGIGIEREFHEQVFAPLERLHGISQYEGHGIGLATCRRVVERHGGRIWAESEGAGTAFRFTLPPWTTPG